MRFSQAGTQEWDARKNPKAAPDLKRKMRHEPQERRYMYACHMRVCGKSLRQHRYFC